VTTSPSDPTEISDAVAEAALSYDDERRSHKWDLAAGRSNYIALISGHVLAILCSVVAAWIGTRILGPAGYGLLSLLVAASLLLGVTTNWTASAVVRYGVKEFVETGRISAIFWTRAATLGVNLLAVILTAPLWMNALTRAVRVPMFLAPLLLAHLLATVGWYHMQQGLTAVKLPKVVAALLTFERLVIVVLLFAQLRFGIVSLQLVVASYIAAAIICIVISAFVLRRMIFPMTAIHRALVREILSFSAPLLPSMLVAYFSSAYLDSFFIARYMTAAAVGIYAVAYQFAGAVMMLHARGGTLLQPFFMSVAEDVLEHKLRQFATRVLPVIAAGWSLACVAAAAIGGPLLLHIFGDHYAAVAVVLWPLMACVALVGPVLIGYFPMALAVGKTSIVAVNAIVAAGLNIALDVLLIPRYGLLGCAWGTVAAYTASLAITIALSDRVLKVRTAWSGIAALPAVAAAAAAFAYGPLAGIAAGLITTAVIVLAHLREMQEGAAILYRAFR